jgi:hypothetical protein
LIFEPGAVRIATPTKLRYQTAVTPLKPETDTGVEHRLEERRRGHERRHHGVDSLAAFGETMLASVGGDPSVITAPTAKVIASALAQALRSLHPRGIRLGGSSGGAAALPG